MIKTYNIEGAVWEWDTTKGKWYRLTKGNEFRVTPYKEEEISLKEKPVYTADGFFRFHEMFHKSIREEGIADYEEWKSIVCRNRPSVCDYIENKIQQVSDFFEAKDFEKAIDALEDWYVAVCDVNGKMKERGAL